AAAAKHRQGLKSHPSGNFHAFDRRWIHDAQDRNVQSDRLEPVRSGTPGNASLRIMPSLREPAFDNVRSGRTARSELHHYQPLSRDNARVMSPGSVQFGGNAGLRVPENPQVSSG